MLVAVTGTPGTGKSSVCDVLAGRGYHVVDLDAAAKELGLTESAEDGTTLVDVDALAARLHVPTKVAFLKGHYAHRIPANLIVVLRCHPEELWRRLRARSWPVEKVRENVEAEAIDVILQEAVGRLDFVFEIDTTRATPRETAESILAIVQGRTEGHEPGSVNWTSEVLSWY